LHVAQTEANGKGVPILMFWTSSGIARKCGNRTILRSQMHRSFASLRMTGRNGRGPPTTGRGLCFQRAWPVGAHHVHRPHLQAMALGVLYDSRGVIEAHGLVVEQRGSERGQIVDLEVCA